MNLTALKTWVSGETLTATDLNGEFQNIYTHTITNSDIDSTGTYVLGELVVGSGITAADGGQFHVHTASAGSVQAHADANEAVLENSAASGLSILSGSSSDGNIFFGDAADNDVGKIAYSHSANSLAFTTNGATALTLSSAQAATFAGDVSVGGALTLTGGLTLNGAVVVGDSASDTLTVNATVTSDLLFTDATYDIGASGATRPRDLFLSRNAVMGGTLGVTGLITATGGVSGSLTGNVTGDLSGNVTGGTISGTTGTFSGAVNANNLVLDASNSYPILLENQDGTTADAAISTYDDANGTLLALGSNFYYNSGSEARFNTSEEASAIVLNRTGVITLRTSDGSNNTVERVSVGNTGDFAVNTSQLFVDQSASAVGIGTSSPTRLLSLYSNSPTSVFQSFTNSSTGNTASDGSQIGIDSNNDLQIGQLESGKLIEFYNNGGLAMVIDSSQRIGLGTSSPSAALSLQFNPATTNGFELIDSRDTNDRVLLTASGGGFSLFTTTTGVGSYASRLSVGSSGAIEIPNQNAINELTFTGTDFTNVFSQTTSGMQFGTTGAGSYLALYAANAEAMRITSDGDLLIGETTNQIARVYATTSTSGDYAYVGVTTHANRGPFYLGNTNASFNDMMATIRADRAATTGYDFIRMVSSASGSADHEFLFEGNGTAYADGSWQGSGADYQEYFESNTGDAAEVGRAIVLDGDRVRYYNADTDSTDDIMGVTRPQADNKNSAVVGNTAWNHWTDKYLTDDWGVYLREDVTVWTYTNDEGNEFAVYERDELAKDPNWTPPEGAVSSVESVRKLNPDYDQSLDDTYKSREERDEWWLIGLLGQIQVKAGEPTNPRWIKMKNISDAVELYYVR